MDRVGTAAAAEPARAALLGVGAQLVVPLARIGSAALALTIVGIPMLARLLPVLLVVAAAALLLGFTATVTRLGLDWRTCRHATRRHRCCAGRPRGDLLPAIAARAFAVAPGPWSLALRIAIAAAAAVEYAAWTVGPGAVLLAGFGRAWTVPPPLSAAR